MALKSLAGGGGGGGGGIPYVRVDFVQATPARLSDFAPPGYGPTTTDIYIAAASLVYLDGIAGGVAGRRVRVWFTIPGGGPITIKGPTDSASLPQNQIVTNDSHAEFQVGAGSGVEFVYDAIPVGTDVVGRWRILVTNLNPPP